MDHQNQPVAKSAARVWRKTLWTFRFYDAESRLRGGERPEDDIERYAEQLAVFLDNVRNACGAPADFKVNLVAHSMGGLVARCYLQYDKLFERSALRGITAVPVNKLFTYGTPHRGISFRDGLGWVEDVRDLLGWRGSDAFGEQRMRKYLSLDEDEPLHTYKPVRGGLPRERIFCTVGTNWQDYPVGVSRATVGPGSDGLVALENAYVKGAARAHIYRSHSGPYGLVNSEEGFQNLDRFLFGSLRYELQLEPMAVTASPLPGQQLEDEVDYLLVEVTVAIRGLHSYIHHRREATMSAVSVPIAARDQENKEPTHLYTGFLHAGPASRKKGDRYIRGAIDVRIEPHYRDEGLFLDSRYEGADLLRDRLYLRLDPKTHEVAYRWNAPDSYRRVSPDDDGAYLCPLPSATQRWLECAGIRIRPAAWD